MRIGFQKYGTLVLLKAKGTLEEKLEPLGFTVKWTEFPAGPQLLEALNVGAIDFGTTGEAPPIFAQAAGAPLVYVGYEPPAPRGEAILVPEGQPAQDGRRPQGQEGRAQQGLERPLPPGQGAGEGRPRILRHRDRSFLPPADARAAFESGAVDAWVIWDPFLAAAEAATGARTLADGTGIVANHQFYLAARDFADAHPRGASTPSLVAARRGRRLGARPIPRRSPRSSPAARHPGADPRGRASTRQPTASSRSTPTVVAEQQKIADTFLELGLIPKRDQDRRRRPEAAVVSARDRRDANVLWFLPTHGDGRYLGTSDRRPRRRSRLPAADRRRPPTASAITACCCRPGAPARTPGSSRRPGRR